MDNSHSLSDYIHGHQRESAQLLITIIFLVWQSSVVVIGLLGYYFFIYFLKLKWWVVLLLGIIMVISAIYFQYFTDSLFNFKNFIKESFLLNFHLWKALLNGEYPLAWYYFYDQGWDNLMGFSLLFTGILGTLDLIPHCPHTKTMKALHQGKHDEVLSDITDQQSKKLLAQLSDHYAEGILLGISSHTGNPIIISDSDVNQIVLVLGTTGGGKTITLRRFYQRAIRQHYPLIMIDGKPSQENVAWVQQLAHQNKRPFFGFNCGNHCHYDPLAHGGYTELKDKIISLKDQWENDYYRSIAEDYLQTTFEVLLKSGIAFDLKRVTECLNYSELALLVRSINDKELMQRVASLESYDRKDITGLQAHLNILIHSELGEFFQPNKTMFNLSSAIQQQGIIYFALPALRFPSFARVLGKLVINDLKAVIDRLNINHPIFTVFDEFSVFAGEQALNLVNMGREKGVHAIFGTQGLADLRKVDPVFLDQMLNCANTLICHRLNDQESAESIANWIGTQDCFTVTAQINMNQGATGMGTVKSNKEFIIHPDLIKQQLKTGEAFYVTKVNGFRQEKVKIKFS